jgi:cobalt-zinc-cadmium efflux system protein
MAHTHPHSHSHEHGHAGGHAHAPAAYDRAFALGIVLNAGFVVAEGIYGVLADSLALLADAGHNLSDVLALVLAWGATMLARRRPSTRFTYGLRGSSILAALANAMLLLVACGAIAWEAILRFDNPAPVHSVTVMTVAAIGIAINGVTAWLFYAGRKADLNIRSAFVHMAADAAISFGVLIAGAIVWYTQHYWVDPVTSLLIVGAIVAGTWALLRDAVSLALAAVPQGIDAAAVRAFLRARPGVTDVHDLHIWGMSTTETALTAHLVLPGGHPGDAYLATLAEELRHRFGIHHATVQIELAPQNHDCRAA